MTAAIGNLFLSQIVYELFPFKNFFHFFYKPFSQSHHFMWGRWWESLLIFQKSLILLVRRIISVINWTATNDAKLPGRFLSFGILELASWASSVKKRRKKKKNSYMICTKSRFFKINGYYIDPSKNPKCPHHPIGSEGKAKKLKVPKFQDAWYICLFILIQKGRIVMVVPIGFFCVLLSMMGKKHENSYYQGYIGEI